MAARIISARRRIAALAVFLVAAGLPVLGLAVPAGADVTDEAEIRAAFTAGTSPITLANDITLTSCAGQMLWVTDADLVINGNGHTLAVDGACTHRVMLYAPSDTVDHTLTIHNLTITGGKGDSGGGGAIYAQNDSAGVAPFSHIVIDQGSVITGNTAAGPGGGVLNTDGNVTLDHATVTSNQATSGNGGGIAAQTTALSVVVRDSAVSNNTATLMGGGIAGGAVTIERSTISGNIAQTSGGGFRIAGSAGSTIVNSTITGNTANGTTAGGGMYAFIGSATVTSSTIDGNTAPATRAANVETNAGTVTFFGSVVAEPQTSSVNCIATVVSSGYNFSDTDTCGFGLGTGDIEAGGDPLLDVLASNGGTAQTMRPLPTSQLLNAVPTVDCTAALTTDEDERTVTRPKGLACEIGAFEVQPVGTPTGLSATPGNESAAVGFTSAPQGDVAIDSYLATCTPTSGPSGSGSGATSPVSVTGLANGTEYGCSVHAVDGYGPGPESSSALVTPRTVPGAPTGAIAATGNKRMTVSFTPPGSNGGNAITGYTVTASPGGATASGAGSPIVVNGLANGIPYTFKVKATNAAGTGLESAPSAPKTNVFQPDVMARKLSVAAFTDVNAYAVASTASTTVKLNRSTTFVIRLFNDGNTVDVINLKAALSGNNRLTFTFKDGAAVLLGMTTIGRNYTLAPGAFKQITVVVKATAGAPLNANRTATLTSKSLSHTTKTDQVKVKVTRN